MGGCRSSLLSHEALLARALAYYALYDYITVMKARAEKEGIKSEELDHLLVELRELIDITLDSAVKALSKERSPLARDIALLAFETRVLGESLYNEKLARSVKPIAGKASSKGV